MSNLFVRNTLQHRVFIMPHQIGKNIDNTIINAIKAEIGNKCVREGFVRKESIELLRRSVGKVDAIHFNGRIGYDVEYSAEVCNPIEGMTVVGKIDDINKMGAIVNISPLSINLPKQYHSNIDIFKDLEVGDQVQINILGCIFEIYDTELNAVGVISKKL